MSHKSKPPLAENTDHGRIVSIPEDGQYLDTGQLTRLEQEFRHAVESAPHAEARLSRQRLLIIFLLIRYTGAKLSEVLAVDPLRDIDSRCHSLVFRGGTGGDSLAPRQVQISETLTREIHSLAGYLPLQSKGTRVLEIDPGFVRRKFYQYAEVCGFARHLAGPEAIRKARAVELMQGNMPLPAVQMMLGHSSPNLTSAYVSFSDDEIRQVARIFMEKESLRRTSARNSFFGKIDHIECGDIQAKVQLTAIDGLSLSAVITNDSVTRLGLKRGRFISAEVKAPWVILYRGGAEPPCSAENRLNGVVTRITSGTINSECVVRVSPATEICAVIASASAGSMRLSEGDGVWVLFTGCSVVLHID